MQDYMGDAYTKCMQQLSMQAVDETGNKIPLETMPSQVYDAKLTVLNYEVENYMLHTVWAAVKNNEHNANAGLFFEPFGFDPAVQDYTIYVNGQNAASQTMQSYGKYDEYCGEEYYATAAGMQRKVFIPTRC